jgi:hypothetical protein
LFYDWRKIYRKTGGSSKHIILVLRAMNMNHLPRNLYDPLYKYYYDDFSGKSFLIQPTLLLDEAFRYRNKEVAEYIGLASFRNYAHYSITKDATLDLLHSPVSEDTINSNRLLRIQDGRVLFKYEKS